MRFSLNLILIVSTQQMSKTVPDTDRQSVNVWNEGMKTQFILWSFLPMFSVWPRSLDIPLLIGRVYFPSTVCAPHPVSLGSCTPPRIILRLYTVCPAFTSNMLSSLISRSPCLHLLTEPLVSTVWRGLWIPSPRHPNSTPEGETSRVLQPPELTACEQGCEADCSMIPRD